MAIDYSKLPRDEFRCPKCGGEFFGSIGPGGVVCCHDQTEQGCRWRGPADQCMHVSCEAKLEFVEEALEKAEAKLDFYLLDADTPWTVVDVLKKLADAADHLLHHHDCDCHGHEEIAVARDVAKAMSKSLGSK